MMGEDLQRMLDSIGDPAYTVDERGIVSGWNEAATGLLGFRKNEILDRRCYELLRGRDVFGNPYCEPHCPLLILARRRETVRHFQMDIYGKQGAALRVLCFVAVLEGEKRRTFSILHILRPVQEPMLPWPGRESPAPASLTRRELEVLRLLADGNTTRGMAATMAISTSTVRKHVQNLMRKLGVGSRLEAVLTAVSMRLL